MALANEINAARLAAEAALTAGKVAKGTGFSELSPSTAFIQSGTSGYCKMPNDMLIQWGTLAVFQDVNGATDLTVSANFPVTFGSCFMAVASPIGSAVGAGIVSVGWDVSNVSVSFDEFRTETQNAAFSYIAIGT